MDDFDFFFVKYMAVLCTLTLSYTQKIITQQNLHILIVIIGY